MNSHTTNNSPARTVAAAIPLRPLGLVKNLVEAIGLDIAYLYDDLIFTEHNAFLLQMGAEKGEEIGVWFNEESAPADRPQLLVRLQEEGRRYGLQVQEKGSYSLADNDNGDGVDIRFNSSN
jgi:hypothetical protein